MLDDLVAPPAELHEELGARVDALAYGLISELSGHRRDAGGRTLVVGAAGSARVAGRRRHHARRDRVELRRERDGFPAFITIDRSLRHVDHSSNARRRRPDMSRGWRFGQTLAGEHSAAASARRVEARVRAVGM
jgi:hypothetical protein